MFGIFTSHSFKSTYQFKNIYAIEQLERLFEMLTKKKTRHRKGSKSQWCSKTPLHWHKGARTFYC